MMTTSNHPEITPPNFFAVKQSQSCRDAEARMETTKARIKELRDEADREETGLKVSTRAQRDQAREDDQRALLVGRVVLKVAGENTNTWNNLWPRIVKSLARASEADRALFGLPAVPRREEKQVPAVAAPAATDQQQVSAAAAPAATDPEKIPAIAAPAAATDPKEKEPAKAADEQ